jgi:hypothetical protein
VTAIRAPAAAASDRRSPDRRTHPDTDRRHLRERRARRPRLLTEQIKVAVRPLDVTVPIVASDQDLNSH